MKGPPAAAPPDEYGIRCESLPSAPARLAAVAYIVVFSAYLWWRTFYTVNLDAAYLSLPLLLADYMGFGFFILFTFNLWRRVRHFAPPPEQGLTVDVLIPTYNESLSVLKPTVVSAIAMRYPHRTFILDDGRREEVRHLCEELGVQYLARGDNRGAKAGNINAALPKTGGDFIAIFDADHAPFEEFLTELLGYFRDPKVALVQAPQAYYNIDSFQHGRTRRRGKPWHEQSVFYDAIMPGKDRHNAAFWCGSSAIVRRTALLDGGGVDTLTVTEDMHTAMGMHARGWKTIYHDRELAGGIAADDLEPFLVQRLRWAQGAMEVLRHDNPLFRTGLTWQQRIEYFTSTAYVIEYIPKTIYLAVPPIVLFTGVLPMTHLGWGLLARFVPCYLLGILATRMLTAGTNPYLESERYSFLKIEIMLRALTSFVWPRKLQFKVTPKGANENDDRVGVLRLIRSQLVAGAICSAAAIWAIVSWTMDAPWALSGMGLLFSLPWALANVGFLVTLVRSLLRRHHRRDVYRFAVDMPMAITTADSSTVVRTIDLSTSGVGWQSDRPYQPGSELTVLLRPSTPVSCQVRAAVMSCHPSAAGYRIGAEFRDLSPENERWLILFLFQTSAPRLVQSESIEDPEAAGSIPSSRKAA